jgi:hypothetical protein
MSARLLFRTALLFLALLVAFSFLHVLVSRGTAAMKSWLGPTLVFTLVLLICLAGG